MKWVNKINYVTIRLIENKLTCEFICDIEMDLFQILPEEIVKHIFSFLHGYDPFLRCVCNKWKRLCSRRGSIDNISTINMAEWFFLEGDMHPGLLLRLGGDINQLLRIWDNPYQTGTIYSDLYYAQEGSFYLFVNRYISQLKPEKILSIILERNLRNCFRLLYKELIARLKLRNG